MSLLLTAVALMAIVTYLTRVIPILLIRRKIQSNLIRSFLYYTPYAVLGGMTFPSILFSTPNLYFSMVGTLVALFLAYREKGLVKVATGAVAVVFLCNLLIIN